MRRGGSGNRCEHYTQENDTDGTRVSIDFRVIPSMRYYRSEYHNSHRRAGKDGTGYRMPRFALGGFYAELGPAGAEDDTADAAVEEEEADGEEEEAAAELSWAVSENIE